MHAADSIFYKCSKLNKVFKVNSFSIAHTTNEDVEQRAQMAIVLENIGIFHQNNKFYPFRQSWATFTIKAVCDIYWWLNFPPDVLTEISREIVIQEEEFEEINNF